MCCVLCVVCIVVGCICGLGFRRGFPRRSVHDVFNCARVPRSSFAALVLPRCSSVRHLWPRFGLQICDKGTADERTIHLAPITLQDGSVCFPVPHEDALRDAGLDIAEVRCRGQLWRGRSERE